MIIEVVSASQGTKAVFEYFGDLKVPEEVAESLRHLVEIVNHLPYEMTGMLMHQFQFAPSKLTPTHIFLCKEGEIEITNL